MKRTILRSATILLFSVVAFGCSGARAPSSKPKAIQEREKILLLDHGLTYYLNVVKHASNRLPGGQLQVKLAIENEENKDVWTDVQVIFRGEDGFEVEKTDWEPVLFHKNAVTNFQRNSLNPSAADYRVLIRNTK